MYKRQGFTVRLDNQEIAYEKVNTAFVGFPIKKGHHTVEITYQMPGKSAGIMVSILSLLIATALYLKQKDPYSGGTDSKSFQ